MILRTRALGPAEQAVFFADRDVVDAGFTAAHESVVVELPLLIAVGAEPVSGVVVILVLEADGYAVVVEGPEIFDEAVVEFTCPFAAQEFSDRGAPLEELGTITPAAVFGVGTSDALGVAGVPHILGEANFLGCGL